MPAIRVAESGPTRSRYYHLSDTGLSCARKTILYIQRRGAHGRVDGRVVRDSRWGCETGDFEDVTVTTEVVVAMVGETAASS